MQITESSAETCPTYTFLTNTHTQHVLNTNSVLTAMVAGVLDDTHQT